MKIDIPDAIEQLKELKKVIANLRLEIAKNLVSVSSAILAILIALKNGSSDNTPLLHYAYVLFLLCILSGLMLLYGVLEQFRKMGKDWLALIILSSHEGFSCSDTKPIVSSKYDGFLKVLEIVCIFSFLMALVLLIWHSFL